MSFWEVTSKLLDGFQETCLIFALTLLLALPLGLLISFGSMSKFKPLAYIVKTFIWIIRGVPLMLQVIIVFYVPGFLLGTPLFSRFGSVIAAFVINYIDYTYYPTLSSRLFYYYYMTEWEHWFILLH